MLIKCSNAEVWFEIDDADKKLLDDLGRTWRWKKAISILIMLLVVLVRGRHYTYINF